MRQCTKAARFPQGSIQYRSEEHTPELQSPDHLVRRLLLEKKKTPTRRPACTQAVRNSRSFPNRSTADRSTGWTTARPRSNPQQLSTSAAERTFLRTSPPAH